MSRAAWGVRRIDVAGEARDGQQLVRRGRTVVGQYDWTRMFFAPGRVRWRNHPNHNATTRLATGTSNAAFSGTLGTTAALAEGAAQPVTTAATTGSIAGGFPVTNGDATGSTAAAQMRWNPTFLFRIKTGASITNTRLLVGCSNGSIGSSATPTTPCVLLRYDTGAGDAGWVVYSYSGSAGSASGVVAPIAADTEYWILLDVAAGGARVNIYLGASPDTLALVATRTADLPGSTSYQNAVVTLTTLENAAKTFHFLAAEGAKN